MSPHGSEHGTTSSSRPHAIGGAAPWSLRSYYRRRSGQFHRGLSSSASSTSHAESIFTKSIDIGSSTLTGTIDGQEEVFELRENVTGRPSGSKEDRHKLTYQTKNVTGSSIEMRLRWWIMRYSLIQITIVYFSIFVGMNFVFAGLWSIQEGRCCDNESLTFAQLFDFAVQTSATIGYGGYVPKGYFANFLVVMISLLTLMLNNVYGGLLLLKFIAPNAKVKFSDVMTLSNLNGIPCLELRIGNEDGSSNVLKDLRARFTYSYRIEYTDENGKIQSLGQTEDLLLIHDTHISLGEVVWTLRHKIDESSPLFGLDFQEFPGKNIYTFEACFNGTQENTGSPVFCEASYALDELMIGHKFVDQISWNEERTALTVDYATFNETTPHPVWYPRSRKDRLITRGPRESLEEKDESV